MPLPPSTDNENTRTPSPSPAFTDPPSKIFDDTLFSNHPRSPIGPDGSPPLLPLKHVHKPTESVRLGLEAALPEGPGPLEEEEPEPHHNIITIYK